MVRGDKTAYSSRQKRQAHHIEVAYEKRGIGEKEAEKRAWATVNKLNGGAKPSTLGGREAPSKKIHSPNTGRMGTSAAKSHLSQKSPISLTIKKTHAKSTKAASRNANSKASGTLARKKPTRAAAVKKSAAARPTAKSSAATTRTAKRPAATTLKAIAAKRPGATPLRATAAKRPTAAKLNATTARRPSTICLKGYCRKRPAATTLRATAARSSVTAKRSPKSQHATAKSPHRRTTGARKSKEGLLRSLFSF